MKKLGNFEVTIRVIEDGPERFGLIVKTENKAEKMLANEWPVPHQGGYISHAEATRMSGYILSGIDRVGTNGEPNFGVV